MAGGGYRLILNKGVVLFFVAVYFLLRYGLIFTSLCSAVISLFFFFFPVGTLELPAPNRAI